jgi:hypothetical protein
MGVLGRDFSIPQGAVAIAELSRYKNICEPLLKTVSPQKGSELHSTGCSLRLLGREYELRSTEKVFSYPRGD